MVKIFNIIILSISSLIILNSEINADDLLNDFNFILKSIGKDLQIKPDEQTISYNILNETSEIKMLGKSLIWLYWVFISSQDKPSCIFSLSCSRFAFLSIEKYGIIYGILMTADRLTRCHGIGKMYYILDTKNDYAIDYPIERYYIWGNGK